MAELLSPGERIKRKMTEELDSSDDDYDERVFGRSPVGAPSIASPTSNNSEHASIAAGNGGDDRAVETSIGASASSSIAAEVSASDEPKPKPIGTTPGKSRAKSAKRRKFETFEDTSNFVEFTTPSGRLERRAVDHNHKPIPIGSLVRVAARTYSGANNKLGGVGKVKDRRGTKEGNDLVYDVTYVLGGRECDIPYIYVVLDEAFEESTINYTPRGRRSAVGSNASSLSSASTSTTTPAVSASASASASAQESSKVVRDKPDVSKDGGAKKGQEVVSIRKEAYCRPCPDIGAGWVERGYERTGGKTKGKIDNVWFSPKGKRFKKRAMADQYQEALASTGGVEDEAFEMLWRAELKDGKKIVGAGSRRKDGPPRRRSTSQKEQSSAPSDPSPTTSSIKETSRESTEPLYARGQIVEKFFPGYGTFKGKIVSLPFPGKDYYRVKYEDGDAEDIHQDNISQFVLDAADPATEQSADLDAIDSDYVSSSDEEERSQKMFKGNIKADDLEEGSRVIVEYQGSPYKATIRRIRSQDGEKSEYIVHYDGSKNNRVHKISLSQICALLDN